MGGVNEGCKHSHSDTREQIGIYSGIRTRWLDYNAEII